MIVSLNNYKNRITKLVEIRSANYVNTDCDIDLLFDIVYYDIANSIVFNTFEYKYTLEKGLNIIELPEFDKDNTARYDDVLGVYNAYGINIDNKLTQHNAKTFSIDTDKSSMDAGDQIVFVLKEVRDLVSQDPKILDDITNAIIEGIMYHISQALPNTQQDQQVANLSSQRYELEKQKLLNKYPQFTVYKPSKEIA